MQIPTVNIIAAADDNGLIGIGDQLPWRIKDELKHFKETTTGHVVIMGRSTYDSIGRPLPNRTNIVFSRTVNNTDKEKDLWFCADIFELMVMWYHCIDKNMKLDKPKQVQENMFTLPDRKEIWCIGGAQIYKKFIDLGLVDTLLLTHVKGDFAKSDADNLVYFPYWNTEVLKNQFPHSETVKETEEYDIIRYTPQPRSML